MSESPLAFPSDAPSTELADRVERSAAGRADQCNRVIRLGV